MVRAMFVAIEGIDGSGKTTQARLLYDRLRPSTSKVLLTSEPSNGAVGKLIRKLLRASKVKEPTFMQLLFVADRAEHVAAVITPKIKRGYTIITDRYLLSTIAYGAASGIDKRWLAVVNSKFVRPDITIILDMAPRLAMQRLAGRKVKEFFERERFQAKLRAHYLQLARSQKNCFVIDGRASIDKVSDRIYSIVKRRLK